MTRFPLIFGPSTTPVAITTDDNYVVLNCEDVIFSNNTNGVFSLSILVMQHRGVLWIEIDKLCELSKIYKLNETITECIRHNVISVQNIVKVINESERRADFIMINALGANELSMAIHNTHLVNLWISIKNEVQKRHSEHNNAILSAGSSAQTDSIINVPTIDSELPKLQPSSPAPPPPPPPPIPITATTTTNAAQSHVPEQSYDELKMWYNYELDRANTMETLYFQTLAQLKSRNEEIEVLRINSKRQRAIIAAAKDEPDNVLAIVHCDVTDSYTIVRRKINGFNKLYRFVKLTANDNKVSRFPETSMESCSRYTIMGAHFFTRNPHENWQKFRVTHPAIMFGLKFKNYVLNAFALHNESQLRTKYYRFLERSMHPPPIDERKRASELIQYNMHLFNLLAFKDANDCVQRCLVSDIWILHRAFADMMTVNSNLPKFIGSRSAEVETAVNANDDNYDDDDADDDDDDEYDGDDIDYDYDDGYDEANNYRVADVEVVIHEDDNTTLDEKYNAPIKHELPVMSINLIDSQTTRLKQTRENIENTCTNKRFKY